MTTNAFNEFALSGNHGPKYRQLTDWLEARIESGELAPGSRLPSERVLAEMTGVSVITVNRAMGELADRNLIARRIGAGTFVLDRSCRSRRRRIGFFYHGRVRVDTRYVNRILIGLFDYWQARDVDLVPLRRQGGEYYDTVAEFQLDGVMVYSPQQEFAPMVLELRQRGVPVIVLSSILPELKEIGFGYSSDTIMASAVDYLAGLGFRDIAFLLPDETSAVYHGRYNGFLSAMWKAKLPINPDWMRSVREPDRGVREILASLPRPAAVICGACEYAVEVYRTAAELGLRIPEDLSVLSIDENEVSLALESPPSSFRIDVDNLTRHGAEALEQLLKGDETSGCELSNFEFVERHSCRSVLS